MYIDEIKVAIDENHNVHHSKQMVFSEATRIRLFSREETVLMKLGGEPLGHRHFWWNFVSSSKERIEQAKADWKEGRINLPL